MDALRQGLSWVAASALAALGIAAFALTRAAWVPCDGDPSSEQCLAAMDAPPHLATVSILWLIALAVASGAIVVLRTRAARVLGAIAAGVVLVMNSATEYLLFLGIAGGHWDVPAGTGYGSSLAFTAAAVLVAIGATVDARRREPRGTRAAALRQVIA